MSESAAPTRTETNRRTQLAETFRVMSASYLTSALVHEMSQPLTAINAWATACLRLVREDEIPRERLAERLQSLVQATERATEVIRTFRKILNRRDPEFGEVDVNRTLGQLVRMLEAEADAQDTAIRLQAAEGLAPVRTDGGLLEIALLVICQNSLDALKLSNRPGREIRIESRPGEAGAVEVTISDNGPGLDEQAIEHLFQPFASNKRSGLGVGLAMSHAILEALGGRLWLKSNSDEGASFALTLPGTSSGDASEPAERTG